MCLDPNCGKDKVAVKAHEPEIVGECPQCGKPLLKRSGRFGEFIGCKGFPKCKFTCSVEELESKLKWFKFVDYNPLNIFRYGILLTIYGNSHEKNINITNITGKSKFEWGLIMDNALSTITCEKYIP